MAVVTFDTSYRREALDSAVLQHTSCYQCYHVHSVAKLDTPARTLLVWRKVSLPFLIAVGCSLLQAVAVDHLILQRQEVEPSYLSLAACFLFIQLVAPP